MGSYERLFKEAERLKPRESLWRSIAAALAASPRSPARASATWGAAPLSEGAQPMVRPAAPPARAAGEGRPWRLAASLAIGLGMMAALAVLFREPPGMASGTGGADSTVSWLAADPGRAGEASATDGLQEWHADLGIPADERFEAASADGWTDETPLFDPLLEE